MGIYHHIRQLWRRPHENLGDLWKQRLIKWRREPATIRIARPTRLDKARAIGYRAKPGIILARQRIQSGGRAKPRPAGGQKSKRFGKRVTLSKNLRQISEERASKKFPNCEVLNSYLVAADSKHYWFEVVLVDRTHPQILSDKKLQWIVKQRGRAQRGKTAAGQRSRGLRWKGKGSEKMR